MIGVRAKTYEELYEELKEAKALVKSTITVTTSAGNTFDGNSKARLNLENSISGIQNTNEILASMTVDEQTAYIETNDLSSMFKFDENNQITHSIWKLADNSIVYATIAELKEAKALAIKEYGRITLATTIEEI